MSLKPLLHMTAITLLLTLVSACTDTEQADMIRQAVAIESGESCHLCGMIIVNYPGPKGEAYTKTSDKVRKFCSTRGLFSYILDPEFDHQIKEIYVHDMSKSPWGKPHDHHFIDARTAWYVVGSNQTGSMGKTLASFGLEDDAKAFSTAYGGQVIPFDAIELTMLY